MTLQGLGCYYFTSTQKEKYILFFLSFEKNHSRKTEMYLRWKQNGENKAEADTTDKKSNRSSKLHQGSSV